MENDNSNVVKYDIINSLKVDTGKEEGRPGLPKVEKEIPHITNKICGIVDKS